jgi:hypothetical protein
MKKTGIVLALFMVLVSAASVFASETFTDEGNANVTGVMADYKASNNVTILCTSAASSYAAFSGHLNGERQYGSSSGDSGLYWSDKTEGTAITTAPTASDSSEFDSGWTAL